jgi:hypothetical protein
MVRVYLAGYTGELGKLTSGEFQFQPFPRREPFPGIVYAGPFYADDEGDPVISSRHKVDQIASADVVLVRPGAEFECGLALGLNKRVVLDIPNDGNPFMIRAVMARGMNLHSSLEAVKHWMIHAPVTERGYRSFFLESWVICKSA